ncbi:TetR/AcrR family transcriptional regulator [Nocardioides sp. GXZ039]|uniref:TetR/AcrR family transcriptional regulator n=1 Tax=Nocardioides sp. GXZ039 TaxID=3136018 RepID=UPI0030F3CBF0
MPRPIATERRAVLLDAALQVVVHQGLRGLTHRAVDREAAVAEGTTSAYFRTRKALHHGLAAWISRRLAGDIDEVAGRISGCDPAGPEALAAVVGLFTTWLDEPALLQAKVELALEAARDAELAELLASDRERVVAIVADILAARGKAHPERRAAIAVASFDGILLAALTWPEADRDAFVAEGVRFTVQPLGQDDP